MVSPLNSKILLGFGICPLRTKLKGPAPKTNSEDIVDEAIELFRANVLFASFDSSEPADKVLVFLTLFLSQCLKRLEKATTKQSAEKLMFSLAKEKFPLPGDDKWLLGAHISKASSRNDQEQLRQYMQQLREEATQRIVGKIYEHGDKNKFWMQFSKRKFLNLLVR